jgi:hypothetical protein
MIAMGISKEAGEMNITAQAIYDCLKDALKHRKRNERERIIDSVLMVADKDEYLGELKDGWNTNIQRHRELLEKRANNLVEKPTQEHWQRLRDMGAKLLEEEKARKLKRRAKKGGWKQKLKKRLGKCG